MEDSLLRLDSGGSGRNMIETGHSEEDQLSKSGALKTNANSCDDKPERYTDCACENRSSRRESELIFGQESTLDAQLNKQTTEPLPARLIPLTALKLLKSTNLSRSLRKISIVGQLNHSTSKGFLLALNSMMLLALLSLVALNSGILLADGSVWSLSKLANQAAGANSNKSSNSNRVARNSGPGEGSGGQQLIPAPISQQFHYFWNHDNIEPAAVASEANKILAEAQVKTDQLAAGAPTALPQTGDAQAIKQLKLSKRQDSISSLVAPGSHLGLDSQPILIPPAVQQQLTAMVLQLQRQQQMSMMMQPRFEPISRLAPQYQANPMSRYWASSSSQHPVIAAPPMLNQMLHADPMQAAGNEMGGSLYQQTLAAQRAPAATLAGGVPVYGPYMVAPSARPPIQAGIGLQQSFVATPQSVSKTASGQPSAGRFATSFLSRRKSWPLFGLGSNTSDRSSILAAGSHLRPTLAMPPQLAPIPKAAPQVTLNLPPESVALLNLASSQLVSAIANQIQAKAAQQKLLTSLGLNGEQQAQDMQGAGSVLSPQHESLNPDQTFNLEAGNQRQPLLQPPYSIPNLNAPPKLGLSNLVNPLLAYSQPSQSFELFDGANNASNLPYGSRLKRRHLNTLASTARATAKSQVSAGDGGSALFVGNNDSLHEVAKEEEPLVEQYFSTFPDFTNNDSNEATPDIILKGASKPKNKQQRSANGQSPSNKRIVKKDASDLLLLGERKKSDQRSAGTNLRQLFKILSSESNFASENQAPNWRDADSTADDETVQEQTQLRRLRRSIDNYHVSRALKSNSGWSAISDASSELADQSAAASTKSKSSIRSTAARDATLAEKHEQLAPARTSQLGIATNEADAPAGIRLWSSVDWARRSVKQSGVGAEGASSLLRRQAEVGEQAASASSSTQQQGNGEQKAASANSDKSPLAEATEETQRQEKSLKVKRITASASVIHHPVSRVYEKFRGSSAKRGLVLSGSPVHFQTTTALPTTSRAEPSQESTLDPMSASLSESARIVNYFQNVDNDSSKASTVSQQYQQTTAQPEAAKEVQLPNLNVGFAAPPKTIESRQNETVKQQNNHQLAYSSNQRTQSANQASGNGLLVQSGDFSPSSPNLPAMSAFRSALAISRQRQPSQQHHQQQLLAAANSADTSSAAQAFKANSFGRPDGQQGQRAQPAQNPASSAGQSQASLLNALLNLNSSQRASSMVPMFGATSQNRHSIVAPNSRPVGQAQEFASPAGDQSNNYSDEINQSSQSSGSSLQDSFTTGTVGEASGRNQIANSQPFNQIDSQPNEQQDVSLSSLNSLSDGSFGSRNFGAENPVAEQGIDLNRLSQQQQYQFQPQGQQFLGSQFNQSDQLLAEMPDSSLYGSSGAFNQLPAQLQQHQHQQQSQPQSQPYQLHPNEASLIAAQTNQPLSPQQQLYSQQMQALNAAVTNFNQQQRFNQQLEDTSVRSFTPQTRAMNLQLFDQMMMNQRSQLGGYQDQGAALYGAVDEEAAAGTAAAAGIPTYPTAAQLAALQSQGHQLNELGGMLMSGSENREQGDSSSNGNSGGAKKPKRKSVKQVSHHYHFNSFGSPLEDPESQFGSLNPFELAHTLNGQENRPNRQKPKANKEEEKQTEEEEEAKPKRKKFLRRFSLRNLFKKLKKEKKKGNESGESGGANSEQSSE